MTTDLELEPIDWIDWDEGRDFDDEEPGDDETEEE